MKIFLRVEIEFSITNIYLFWQCLKKLVVTLNNMDPKWDVIVADIVDTLVVVRLPVFHTEDFDAWMLEFSNATKTSWNVFKRFHNKVRYISVLQLFLDFRS